MIMKNEEWRMKNEGREGSEGSEEWRMKNSFYIQIH